MVPATVSTASDPTLTSMLLTSFYLHPIGTLFWGVVGVWVLVHIVAYYIGWFSGLVVLAYHKTLKRWEQP